MFHFIGDTVDDLFLEALAGVIDNGEVISPRGLKTREIFPASFELTNPRARILLTEGRCINPAFAIAEALWILSGSQDPWIFDYNSKLKQFANDGTLRGAYGPRIRAWGGHIDQLARARDVLTKDRSSRRAIIQIYDPNSVDEGHLDVPCTITHHFLIRREQLHLFTTMRGQDVWLGLPYDIFYNTLLQELMAGWVGAELGSYYYRADSFHIYEQDIPAARALCSGNCTHGSTRAASMSPVQMDWERREEEIAATLQNCLPSDHVLAPLARTLESYRDWKTGAWDRSSELAAGVTGPLGKALQRWYAHLSARSPRGEAVT